MSSSKADEWFFNPIPESPEHLARDPYLAILPSGRAVSLQNIRCTEEVKSGVLWIVYHGSHENESVFQSSLVIVSDPLDIAAIRVAIGRVGVTVYPPTTKGSDADGDGKVGEP